jgi:hypothetical protein
MTKADDEQQQRTQFGAVLADAHRWRDKARDLLEAAACLEPRVRNAWHNVRAKREPAGRWFDDVHGPYFMLVAFALENLCKAVLVHRRPP